MDDGTWNDWPAAENAPPTYNRNEEGRNALKRSLRLAINGVIANGMCDPEEAFGVLMFVASSYVAQIKDAAARAEYIKQVAENFGTMVDLLRAGDDRLMEAMAEAVDAMRQ